LCLDPLPITEFFPDTNEIIPVFICSPEELNVPITPNPVLQQIHAPPFIKLTFTIHLQKGGPGIDGLMIAPTNMNVGSLKEAVAWSFSRAVNDFQFKSPKGIIIARKHNDLIPQLFEEGKDKHLTFQSLV